MAAEDIRSVLEELAAGNTTVDAALLALRKEPFSDLGYAKVDHHREMRHGAAEVIYGASKTYDQIKGISQSLLDNGQTCILITRVSAESAALLAADFVEVGFTYHEIPRLAIVGSLPEPTGNGTIVVAAAGTSDLAVAKRQRSRLRRSATRWYVSTMWEFRAFTGCSRIWMSSWRPRWSLRLPAWRARSRA